MYSSEQMFSGVQVYTGVRLCGGVHGLSHPNQPDNVQMYSQPKMLKFLVDM